MPAALNKTSPKKVFLVMPKPHQEWSNRPPIGIASIAAYLESKGHEVRLFDMSHTTSKEFRLQVKRHQPDFVGIGMTTPLVASGTRLAEEVRKLSPKTTLVCGGAHPTALPEAKELGIFDRVVVGDGEFALERIINEADKPGQKERVVHGELIGNLDSLPFPALEKLPMDKYRRKDGKMIVPISIGRGCPFGCIYCAGMFKKSRLRSAESAYAEIKLREKQFGKSDKTVMYVVDESIAYSRDRLERLCELIKKGKLNVRWKCMARANQVDEAILRKMKEAGCSSVSFGVETLDPTMLKKSRKGTTIEDYEKAFAAAKKAGLSTTAFMIVGLPGQTKENLSASIEKLKELDPDYANWHILMAYPGSPLWKDPEKHGLTIYSNTDWNRANLVRPSVTTDDRTISITPKGVTPRQLLGWHAYATREWGKYVENRSHKA